MRFTSVFVAGALAVAARAQTSTSEEASTTTFELDPVQSSIIACIDECDPTDVNCLADCNPVPRPNETQAIDTIECVAQCDQGDGSEADTEAYSRCTQQCITDLFYEDGEGTPDNSGSGGSDSTTTTTNTASESEETGSETTGSDDSEEPTESGASATESNAENDSTETTSGAATTETTDGGDDEGAAATLVGSILAGGLALVLAL